MSEDVELFEAKREASRALPEGARTLYEQGLADLSKGRDQEALVALRAAAEIAPEAARVRSALGVAVARAEGDFESSRTLCESAAKQEFFNPEVYLNLARVYLRFGRRSEALRYLRRGQMIDPGNVAICETMAELGRRRLPIVPFLPRRHPVNRALGTARSVVFGGLRGR